MAQVVGYPLDGGGVLFVQAASADEPSGSIGLASSQEDRRLRAAETLESAMDHLTPALQSVVSKLRRLSPDELSVEFHLTLTAETGVVVSKGLDEAHFTVTLAWARERRPWDGGGDS